MSSPIPGHHGAACGRAARRARRRCHEFWRLSEGDRVLLGMDSERRALALPVGRHARVPARDPAAVGDRSPGLRPGARRLSEPSVQQQRVSGCRRRQSGDPPAAAADSAHHLLVEYGRQQRRRRRSARRWRARHLIHRSRSTTSSTRSARWRPTCSSRWRWRTCASTCSAASRWR